MKKHSVSSYDSSIPVVTMNKPEKQQLQEDPNCVLIKPKYAVISTDDIHRQVGLIETGENSLEHSVIGTYMVYNNDFSSSVGNIKNL